MIGSIKNWNDLLTWSGGLGFGFVPVPEECLRRESPRGGNQSGSGSGSGRNLEVCGWERMRKVKMGSLISGSRSLVTEWFEGVGASRHWLIKGNGSTKKWRLINIGISRKLISLEARVRHVYGNWDYWGCGSLVETWNYIFNYWLYIPHALFLRSFFMLLFYFLFQT